MAQEFSIPKLLELTENGKYATTAAGFKAIDLLEQIEIPKKLRHRKAAVQALYTLSNKIAQWDYISDEQRQALQEELEAKERVQLEQVFGPSITTQPKATQGEQDDSDAYLHSQERPPEELVAVKSDIASGFSIEDNAENKNDLSNSRERFAEIFPQELSSEDSDQQDEEVAGGVEEEVVEVVEGIEEEATEEVVERIEEEIEDSLNDSLAAGEEEKEGFIAFQDSDISAHTSDPKS